MIAGPQIIGWEGPPYTAFCWRVAGGQLYLGGDPEGASSDSVLSFAVPPVPVGGPINDPTNALRLSAARTGVVALSSALPAAPALASAGLHERLGGWDTPMELPFSPDDRAYVPLYLLVGNEAGEPEVWLFPAADALLGAEPIAVSPAGIAPDQLMVPELSLRVLADGPPALLSTAASGGAELSITDGRAEVARTALALRWPAGPSDISAGDVNGDGLSDIVVGAGSTAAVHLSDGRGGLLEGEGPAPEARTSFGVLLGGSAEGDECAVDGDGGGLYTLGRALFGASAR